MRKKRNNLEAIYKYVQKGDQSGHKSDGVWDSRGLAIVDQCPGSCKGLNAHWAGSKSGSVFGVEYFPSSIFGKGVVVCAEGTAQLVLALLFVVVVVLATSRADRRIFDLLAVYFGPTAVLVMSKAMATPALGDRVLFSEFDPRPANVQLEVVRSKDLVRCRGDDHDHDGVAVIGFTFVDQVDRVGVVGNVIFQEDILFEVIQVVVLSSEEHRHGWVTLLWRFDFEGGVHLRTNCLGEGFCFALVAAQNGHAVAVDGFDVFDADFLPFQVQRLHHLLSRFCRRDGRH